MRKRCVVQQEGVKSSTCDNKVLIGSVCHVGSECQREQCACADIMCPTDIPYLSGPDRRSLKIQLRSLGRWQKSYETACQPLKSPQADCCDPRKRWKTVWRKAGWTFADDAGGKILSRAICLRHLAATLCLTDDVSLSFSLWSSLYLRPYAALRFPMRIN